MSDPSVSDPSRRTYEIVEEPVREVQPVREVERVPEPETGLGLVGYAAIKYTAIVVIVLAILAFLAWYVLPRVTS